MAGTNFWTTSGTEPKRQYRFTLSLGGLEQWTIKKVSRPSFEISNAEHNYINHTFYYPGRVTWSPISFTVVDPVMPDTSTILMQMLVASGYRFPDVVDGTRTISKQEAIAACGGSVKIHMLGAGPAGGDVASNQAEIIESWTLVNPWIESVSMGDLAYDSDDLVEIECSLRYDNARIDIMGQGGYGSRASTAGTLGSVTAGQLGDGTT